MPLIRGLSYKSEDGEAASEFVLLCCYTVNEDGSTSLLTDMDSSMSDKITSKNSKVIFDVGPGEFPQFGQFEGSGSEEGDSGFYNMFGDAPTFLITRAAYMILKQVWPEFQPHMLLRFWEEFDEGPTTEMMKIIGDYIDFGPMALTHQRLVDWVGIWFNPGERWSREAAVRGWKELLSNPNYSTDHILHEAWRGKGNLWCMKAPNVFPIHEDLSLLEMGFDDDESDRDEQKDALVVRLPQDVLILICELLHPRDICAFITTCRGMLNDLIEPANRIVHSYIKTFEPWFLPAGPFDIPYGRDEIEFWHSAWGGAGYSSNNLDSDIPWLAYRRACSQSLNMWNRIRIWGIVKQWKKLATDWKFTEDREDTEDQEDTWAEDEEDTEDWEDSE
ncbi:hypothetical protein CVT24_002301 [Panaeolus cyanescens]|uniref:F-box domain-containing protein n=1 Tax=Panaeolus cyanescens TaxID=181874 RepID=A0A409YIL8_9AGAR|nr:hypothetical protein CVT24_002301 [Panaeolus cyanescens]